MDIECQVSNLTNECVVLFLRDDVANEGDYEHLHYERLPEVSLCALILEDPVNIKQDCLLAKNLPPVFAKLNDLHTLSLKSHLI